MEDLKKFKNPNEPAAIFVAAVFKLTTVPQKDLEENIKQAKTIMEQFQYDKYLPYPEITNYMFANGDSISPNNLELILDEYFEDEFSKKFKRHMNLALTQKHFFSQQLKDIDAQLNDLVNIKGKLYSEFIAILGIFSALIFGLLGSLSIFGELGSALKETPLYKIFVYIGLVSIAITLISFLSYNAVAKISNLRLRSCGCNAENCYHNPVQKHPTVFMMIFVFLISISIGLIMTLLTRSINFYQYTIGDTVISAHIQKSVVLVLLLIIPIVYISIVMFLYFKKQKK